MSNNMLRAPLVKSAVLLTVFSLLVYLTATSPDGSVWDSLGKILLVIFSAAQFGIGLILALALCFVVLAGIFLGGLALISRESAAQVYNQFRQVVSDKLLYLKSLVIRGDQASGAVSLDAFGVRLKSEIVTEMQGSLESLGSGQRAIEERYDDLQGRVELAERMDNSQALAKRLNRLEEKVSALADQLQVAREDGSVAELAGRVETCAGVANENEAAVQELVLQVASLRDDVASVQAIAVAVESADAAVSSGDGGEPRLLAYIEDPKVRHTIDLLVAETLKQDMTNARIIDYLVKKLDKKTGKILTDHPSLTKEYLRDCRKK